MEFLYQAYSLHDAIAALLTVERAFDSAKSLQQISAIEECLMNGIACKACEAKMTMLGISSRVDSSFD